ncbi:hypothetical protein PHYBLDRAFT_149535 [Phycomyces blakesleeanus NRRL 1555(-)]|uniref:Uncharacterized protein n=1 Tax=Phycomyces blakesleeanus (strain ATCC 8743b / DSM 1359 / FGSC 10004 / NBRC 33097 / NRRL 1555) TaxID=763407 RepID=A0A162WMT2_PHYB8|nr:hypothetical protein PHYBLDRAFT_149535 [Phycomyces blakesleeanus NRRL 1555(-)]OAD69135.1 hypothetical protein PHYBLDRAFT_149535 [Phycomyces blakesleeanus NRRL 1555(-)]|eukprot:XP_018287175.1 hypothetical protein PHYBLDRAFT_149535 [Phycomyces blakesleeanus NRRL 1555(-)]
MAIEGKSSFREDLKEKGVEARVLGSEESCHPLRDQTTGLIWGVDERLEPTNLKGTLPCNRV